jgi:transcriptional regulator with XRE-family HTH domain
MSAPTARKIIDDLGGASALARRLGVSRQAVSMWAQRGFPRDIDTVLKLEDVFRSAGIIAKPYEVLGAPSRPSEPERQSA